MKAAVLLVLFLLLPAQAAAAELSELREVPKDFWNGFKEQGRPEGLLTLLAAGAGASIARYGGTTTFDDVRIAGTLQRHAPLGSRATDFGAVIGYPLYLIPAMGATYFAGWSLDARSTQEFGLSGFEALALAGLETEILKVSVRRVRPDHSDLAAFPSGHTSASFALATVAASQWGWEVGVPACLLAGFVGYTRMESNKHYLSDVLAGAGVGIISGRAVYKTRRRAHPDRYVFAPFVSPGGGGVTVFF
ncbi:MAG: phosphatase PAP2 family protein [Elusimicrobia bacterium]|nr:phosphatase PAP2 family protein [Elusimicrobiota bacterium]